MRMRAMVSQSIHVLVLFVTVWFWAHDVTVHVEALRVHHASRRRTTALAFAFAAAHFCFVEFGRFPFGRRTRISIAGVSAAHMKVVRFGWANWRTKARIGAVHGGATCAAFP